MQSHRARAESVREMRSHGSGAESRRRIGFVGAQHAAPGTNAWRYLDELPRIGAAKAGASSLNLECGGLPPLYGFRK